MQILIYAVLSIFSFMVSGFCIIIINITIIFERESPCKRGEGGEGEGAKGEEEGGGKNLKLTLP